jgi:hypothetical protein
VNVDKRNTIQRVSAALFLVAETIRADNSSAQSPPPPPPPKKNPYKSIPAGYIYSLWGDQSTAIIRLVHLSDDSYSLLVRKW